MLFQQLFHEVHALKDCKNSHENNWARVSFHKAAGLQPAVLLKNILWLRCFPVNFNKFLENVFHRTPLGKCFLKFYFRFIMTLLGLLYYGLFRFIKWKITGQWRIRIHKYINDNQSIKTPSDSMWCRGQMLTKVSPHNFKIFG